MENLVKLLSDEDKEKLRRILYNEYYVKYRKEHREIINLHNGRGIICEYCERQVNKSSLTRHQRSWKCTQSRINKTDQNTNNTNEINTQKEKEQNQEREQEQNQEKEQEDNDLSEEYKSDN